MNKPERNFATPSETQNLLDTALSDIRARNDEFQTLRHIPEDIIEQFKKIGVYRAFVPKRLGGDGISPMAFLSLIEKISAADASAGWVASFGVSSTYLAALPVKTFEHIYGNNPDTVFAGGLFPPQLAKPNKEGVEVTGRWTWCSGCMCADLLGAGIKIADEATPFPRTAVMHRKNITIDQTWDSVGLRGTGSHDLVVDQVTVPKEWTFVRGSKSSMQDQIFRYPAMALAAQVLAVVALGAAREALDFLLKDAATRASITGAPNPGARPNTQAGLAKAEAKLAGARHQFYDATEKAWEELEHNDELSRQAHIGIRLAATAAAHEGAEVARLAFVQGGAGAMMRGHLLARTMIDAACVAQHAFINDTTWTSAGAAMFNQPTPPGYP